MTDTSSMRNPYTSKVTGRTVDLEGPGFRRNNPQGSLFSVKQLNRATRTGDEVGHKGFSVNRLREVQGAYHVHGEEGSPRVWDAKSAAEDPDDISESAQERMVSQDVHEMIARSSMPSTDIGRTAGMGIRVETLIGNAGGFGPEEYARIPPAPVGEYSATHFPNEDMRIKLDPNFGMDPATAIHELGHAVDYVNTRESMGGILGRVQRPEGSGLRSNYFVTPDQDAASDSPASPTSGAFYGASGDSANYYLDPEGSTRGVASARGEAFADAYADKHAGGSDSAYPRYGEIDWARYGGEDGFDLSSPAVGDRTDAYAQSRYKFSGGLWDGEGSLRQGPKPQRTTQESFPGFNTGS